MERENMKQVFAKWLKEEKGLADGTCASYVSNITSASKFIQNGNNSLFLLDDTTNSSIEAIIKSPDFLEKNNKLHNSMSSALKYYVEFISFQITSINNKELVSTPPQEKSAKEVESSSGYDLFLKQLLYLKKEQRKIRDSADSIEDEEQSDLISSEATNKIRILVKTEKFLAEIEKELAGLGLFLTKRSEEEKAVLPVPQEVDNVRKSETIPTTKKAEETIQPVTKIPEPLTPSVTKAPDTETPPVRKMSDSVESPMTKTSDSVAPTETKVFDSESTPVMKNVESAEPTLTTPEIKNSVPSTPVERTTDKPLRFSLLNQNYAVSHWREVLVKVCEIMLIHNPYEVALFPENEKLNSDRRINFSFNEQDIKFNKKKLSNGMWIEVNRNAIDIKAVCRKILSLCGYDPNDFIITTEGG